MKVGDKVVVKKSSVGWWTGLTFTVRKIDKANSMAYCRHGKRDFVTFFKCLRKVDVVPSMKMKMWAEYDKSEKFFTGNLLLLSQGKPSVAKAYDWLGWRKVDVIITEVKREKP